MQNVDKIKVRCIYSYQKYPRKIMTTSLRKDLRQQLKELSFKEHEYETKILDMVIDELINNKSFQKKILDKVRSYY